MNNHFIPEQHIENAAHRLIIEFGEQFGSVTAPPVPVEWMLESYLGWNLEFNDLIAKRNLPDALGAIFPVSRRVVIDSSLDSTEHPNMEGRYNFTVAHEIGHIRLHLHLLGGGDIFQDAQKEAILCRDSNKSKKPPIEWQADRFASYLLMPTNLVLEAWQEATKGYEPKFVEKSSNLWRMGTFTQGLAERFKVSQDAMRIRLEMMNLEIENKWSLTAVAPG